MTTCKSGRIEMSETGKTMTTDEKRAATRVRRQPIQMSDEDIQVLRLQVQGAMSADPTLRLTAFAAELGVPASTFELWLTGKYQGRNDQIGMRVLQGWRVREDRLAVRAQVPDAPGFTLTPTAIEFLEIFSHAHHLPDMVAVTGAAGIGKSSAACHYTAQNFGSVWKIVASPAVIGPRAVLDALARVMGLVEFGALHKLEHLLIMKLRGTHALIMVDEAQHLQPAALDSLRALHDQAYVGIALLGNETVVGKIDGGQKKPEYAQLYSRVGRRLTRKGVRKGDAPALLDAAQVDDEEVRGMLNGIAARPGALRGMVKTLRMAQLLAAREQVPLEARHVTIADANLSGQRVAA